jgi:ABC-2 type transport system ATP-binding protein
VLADAAAFQQVARAVGGRAVQCDPARLSIGVATDGSAAQVRALLDGLDPGRRAVARFAVHTATLDDVFLALTGRTTSQPEKETANV